MNAGRAAATYAAGSATVAVGSGALAWAVARAAGLAPGGWAVAGWAVLAAGGSGGGAWLAAELGRRGPGFLIALGTGMLARLAAVVIGSVAASGSPRSVRSFLAGAAVGFAPVMLFEGIWFWRAARAAGLGQAGGPPQPTGARTEPPQGTTRA